MSNNDPLLPLREKVAREGRMRGVGVVKIGTVQPIWTSPAIPA